MPSSTTTRRAPSSTVRQRSQRRTVGDRDRPAMQVEADDGVHRSLIGHEHGVVLERSIDRRGVHALQA